MSEPSVIVRGDVPDAMVAYGRKRLLAAIGHVAAPILKVELRLDHHTDPARERPDNVEMMVDCAGTRVRAHAGAPTMTEAIDRTASRLRRRIEAVLERPQTERRRHRDTTSWHHDDAPVHRGGFFPRPVEERVLARRKTYVMHPEAIEDALFDLEVLDHDFFLFVHDESAAEAVVYRVDHGYGLMQRVETPEAIKELGIPIELGPVPAVTSLEAALALLDETDVPFEFFVDEDTDRGEVAYRRYDGHYGLILSR